MSTEPDRYVTWNVGAEELGVSKGSFFYDVHMGRIQEDPTREEKDGKYLWSSILARKAERRQKHRRPYTPRRAPVFYDWIRPVDIPLVLKLDLERYGETAEYEINYQEVAEYQEQYKKNPQLAMAAWSIDRRECLGYISLIPLAEPLALDIMAGKRDEASLTLDEIETYERPGGYVLLCRSVVARQDHSSVLMGILRGIMNYWRDQYPDRYVTRVYAQTASQEGLRLLRHLFLMPMAGYPDNAYYLDFARFNPSRLVREFLASLEEIAPLPDDLTRRYTPPLPTEAPYKPPRASARVIREQGNGSTRSRPLAAVEPSPLPAEVPPGSIALATMAEELGIHRTTLLGHVTTEANKKAMGVVLNPENGLKHFAVAKPGRPEERLRYFTSDQAQALRTWHAANAKKRH